MEVVSWKHNFFFTAGIFSDAPSLQKGCYLFRFVFGIVVHFYKLMLPYIFLSPPQRILKH